MQLIQHVTVESGGTSAITFSGIPSTFTDLVVVVSARTTQAISSWSDVALRFNSSTSNYSSRIHYGGGSGAGSSFTETSIIMRVSTANNTASTFASYQAYVSNYRSGNTKVVSLDGANETNTTLAIQKTTSGLWSDASAITTLSLHALSGTLVEFSSASLYGITAGSSGGVTVS